VKLRVSLAIALAASMCVGCDDTHHARISQGAGLGEGSPVMVSGVRVGQVEGVTVIEGQVDVELSISSDHQVTLRQDACALATAAGGEPALVLLPGTGAPREGDAVIAECALPGADLGEAMRGIGEGMRELLEQLAQGMRSPPSSPPSAPPGLPPARAGDICEGATVRVDGEEPVAPVPRQLPDGGRRVWLVFENPADRTLQLGPIGAATFADRDGRALRPVSLPGADAWVTPVRVPAHGSARVHVVFPGSAPTQLDRVEIPNTRPADAVGQTCTLLAFGL